MWNNFFQSVDTVSNSMDRRHVLLPCSVTVDAVCHQLHHSSDTMLTVFTALESTQERCY